jgi:NAD(P)-dependent dehydrogenase (short-subunit alcohol dehydrogenase family)
MWVDSISSRDVTDDAAVGVVITSIEKDFGGLHVAVNNAGIGGELAPTGDQTPSVGAQFSMRYQSMRSLE